MEMTVVRVSSKGQVVIPSGLREEMGLSEGDELYAFGKDDTLILKKISKKDLEREFDEIVGEARAKARKAGLTRKDVQKEIEAFRRAQRKLHARGG